MFHVTLSMFVNSVTSYSSISWGRGQEG